MEQKQTYTGATLEDCIYINDRKFRDQEGNEYWKYWNNYFTPGEYTYIAKGNDAEGTIAFEVKNADEISNKLYNGESLTLTGQGREYFKVTLETAGVYELTFSSDVEALLTDGTSTPISAGRVEVLNVTEPKVYYVRCKNAEAGSTVSVAKQKQVKYVSISGTPKVMYDNFENNNMEGRYQYITIEVVYEDGSRYVSNYGDRYWKGSDINLKTVYEKDHSKDAGNTSESRRI